MKHNTFFKLSLLCSIAATCTMQGMDNRKRKRDEISQSGERTQVRRAKRVKITRLGEAIEKGDAHAVAALLKSGVSANEIVDKDLAKSALREAVICQHPNIVTLLLDNNAAQNEDCEYYKGYTPFGLAVRLGYVDVVRAFFEHKKNTVDVNHSTNECDETALYLATRKGHTQIVRMLLYHKDGRGRGDIDIDAQTSLNVYNWDEPAHEWADETPLCAAIVGGHANIVKLLLEYRYGDKKAIDVNNYKADLYWYTPLYVAVQCDSPNIVRILLAHGANPNAVLTRGRGQGTSSLFEAAMRGYAGVVKELLEYGANPNTVITFRREFGGSPLNVAVVYRHVNVVKLLLEGGANPDVESRNHGFTTLYRAVRAGDARIVQLLLKHGARVDSVLLCYQMSFLGHTINNQPFFPRPPRFIPMDEAIRMGDISIIYLLLKKADTFSLRRAFSFIPRVTAQPAARVYNIIRKMVLYRIRIFDVINKCQNFINACKGMIHICEDGDQDINPTKNKWEKRKEYLEQQFDNYVYKLICDGAREGNQQCQKLLLLSPDFLPFRSKWLAEKNCKWKSKK